MEIVQADITTFKGDALVNAANSRLIHGGGVARAISLAAGPGLDRESRELVASRGPVAVGDAVATGGHDLKVDWVIHAVGPIYGSHDGAEERLLAYRRSLAVARELGVGTMAFPAISAGTYGYPLGEAARIALTTVAEESADIDVTFVLFGDDVYAAFESALAG